MPLTTTSASASSPRRQRFRRADMPPSGRTTPEPSSTACHRARWCRRRAAGCSSGWRSTGTATACGSGRTRVWPTSATSWIATRWTGCCGRWASERTPVRTVVRSRSCRPGTPWDGRVMSASASRRGPMAKSWCPAQVMRQLRSGVSCMGIPRRKAACAGRHHSGRPSSRWTMGPVPTSRELDLPAIDLHHPGGAHPVNRLVIRVAGLSAKLTTAPPSAGSARMTVPA